MYTGSAEGAVLRVRAKPLSIHEREVRRRDSHRLRMTISTDDGYFVEGVTATFECGTPSACLGASRVVQSAGRAWDSK